MSSRGTGPGGAGPGREGTPRESRPSPPPPTSRPGGFSPALPEYGPRVLARLVELGRELALEPDARGILSRVLHAALELAGMERGFVALVREGEGLEFVLAEDVRFHDVPEPEAQVSRTLVAQVLRSGRAVHLRVPAGTIAGGAEASLAARNVGRASCLPLGSYGATIGVLYLDGPRAPAVPRRMPEILECLAGLAAAALESAWQHRVLERELERTREALRRERTRERRRRSLGMLVGVSPAMQEVYRRIEAFATSDEPVLVTGETGTGKELAARLVHERSARASGEWVAVNCAGLPESLLEDELFGHEKGAFTGADRPRPGLFELAHGGTLFLDEIGETSPRMQGALLRVLETGEVRRLGGLETVRTDVRIVAATHRDLEGAAREGRFRRDLLYRLDVLRLPMPPLRERPEDLPLLVAELLRRIAGDAGALAFTPAAHRRLLRHGWPGNVRELENLLRRLLVAGLRTVGEDDLPAEIGAAARPFPSGTLREIEAEAIRRALERTRGNRTAAARLLGIDRKTLAAKLRRSRR